MVGRCAFFLCALSVILITNTVHCLEEDNVLSDNKSLKKIELRNSSNATATLQETPAYIQQGNNVYIKPKFIIGSPFTSNRQGNKPEANIAVTSKVPNEEINIVVGKTHTPEITSVIVPPVVDINSIPPPRFPIHPQLPILGSNPCLPIRLPITFGVYPTPCPSFQVPVLTDIPQPPRYPAVQNPIRPVVIPKPPELPPIILPKLPIEVIVEKPDLPLDRVPSPELPIFIPLPCPPMVKCVPPERGSSSITDIFTGIFEKLKNVLSISSRIDLTQFFEQNDMTPDLPLALPTFCAQGIIAERVVPNMIKYDDNNIKVLMSPIFPSQFTQSGFYKK